MSATQLRELKKHSGKDYSFLITGYVKAVEPFVDRIADLVTEVKSKLASPTPKSKKQRTK